MSSHIKTDGKKTIEVSLDVLLIKEGDYIVSYCPELELSSFGSTENEAKIAFESALKIFLDEVHKRGTLDKVLLDLGWTLRKVPTASFQPPVRDITDRYPVIQKSFNERVLIPV